MGKEAGLSGSHGLFINPDIDVVGIHTRELKRPTASMNPPLTEGVKNSFFGKTSRFFSELARRDRWGKSSGRRGFTFPR